MKKTSTPKKVKKFNKVTEKFQNIFLDGNILRAEKVITTFEVKKEVDENNHLGKLISEKIIDEKVIPLNFPLVEVTTEELAIYKKNGVSSFVLKMDGKFYYSSIPKDMNLVSCETLSFHKCALSKRECHRLSAASDENGGCAKVRDGASNIERYPWITAGYETFNTKYDCFAVFNCLHYEPCPPRRNLSPTELSNLKLGLAQFVWPDVNNIEDVKRRKKRNRGV